MLASIAATIALIGAPLAVTGAIMVTSAQPAEAATVPVGNVRARMADHVSTGGGSTQASCIRYSPPRSGNQHGSSPSAWVGVNGTAQTAHGYPSGGRCPNRLTSGTQSTLGFTPLLTGEVTTGTPFLLGRFEHINRPISGTAGTYYTGLLEVELGDHATLEFPWDMWETTNTSQLSQCDAPGQISNTPCDDRTRFTNQIDDSEITIDGRIYHFVVQGFSHNYGSTQCAATPTDGVYPNEFWTEEGETTYGCLYATLSEIRTLEIVKETVAPTQPTSPTTFSYGTSSSLAGSPWANTSFVLSDVDVPGTKAGPTRKILEGETVTITENQLPPYWRLSDLACVDGVGAPLPEGSVTYTGQSVSITAGASPSEAARAISCTFTNSYEPTGTLTLVKSVDGGALAASDWTLSATRQGNPAHSISGTSGSAGVTNRTVPAGTFDLTESANDGSRTGYDLVGWNCTGATGTTPGGTNHAVQVKAGENVRCTATNKWQESTFKVTKEIIGELTGFTGDANTEFNFNYSCTNGSDGTNRSVTTSSPWTSPMLPVGTECTVAEVTPSGNLADASYSWAQPQVSYPGSGESVVITAGTSPEVAITNKVVQNTGSLTIAKNVTPRDGTPAGYIGERAFAIDYTCTVGSQNTNGTVNLAAGANQTITGIPAGSLCTITEAAPTFEVGDFSDPSFGWDGNALPDPVTIAANQNVNAEVTNYYTQVMGELKIAKKVVGEGYTGGNTAAFTIAFDCGAPYNGTVDLSEGGTTSISVPRGVACMVQEVLPLDAGLLLPSYEWNNPSYEGLTDGYANWDGDQAKVTVVNSTEAIFGSVTVTKEITGAADGVLADTTFPITLTCGDREESGEISANNDFTIAGVPVGTSCSVTETAPTGSAGLKDISYVWGNVSISDPVTITKGETAELTVTNHVKRAFGSITIAKEVDGIDGLNGSSVPFSGTWSCNYDGETYAGTWSRTGSGAASLTGPSSAIPLSALCSVTENPVTTPPHPDDASYVWAGATITDPITVTTDAKQANFKVKNPILRQTGTVGVVKEVEGDSAGYNPAAAFTFSYVCTPPSGPALSGSVQATPGGAVVSLPDEIPVGSVCTITEQTPPTPIDPYRWDGVSYSVSGLASPLSGAGDAVTFTVPGVAVEPPPGTEGAEDEVEITEDAGEPVVAAAPAPTVFVATPVTVSFENTLTAKAAQLKVKKTVAGATAGVTSDASFNLAAVCAPTEAGIADATPFGSQSVGVDGTATFDVPLGQYCKVVEITNSGGLLDASYAWGGVTYPEVVQVNDNGASVTVTNHVERRYGELTINKAFTDNGNQGAIPADWEFGGTWSCTYPGTPSASFDGTWSATKENSSATLIGDADNGTQIPLTSNCVVTETSGLTPLPNDPSYHWDTATSPGIESLGAGSNNATVTNTLLRDVGSLTVVKQLSGLTAGFAGSSAFHVTYTCTNPADGTAAPMTGTASVSAGADPITLVDNVPAGWECVVDETARPALVDASYRWADPIITIDAGATKEVTVAAGTTHAVAVENPIERVTGTLTITKAFAGQPAATLVADLTYGGTYVCEYGDGDTAETYSGTWSVTGAGEAEYDGDTAIPLTSICSVAETQLPDLPLSWAWTDPQITEPLTIDAGDPAAFVVTNSVERVYGSLSVTKVFEGHEAALTPEFGVQGTWECTWDETGIASGTWQLPAAGGTQVVFDAEASDTARVPLDALCVIRENTLDDSDLVDASYSWMAPEFSPGTHGSHALVVLTPQAQANEAIVINNTERVYGGLTVTKNVTGPATSSPQYNAEAQFSGTYTCTYGDDAPVIGTWGPIAAGETAQVAASLLIGSECELTEDNVGQSPVNGDSSFVWLTPNIVATNGTVTSPDEPASFTVTNATERVTGAFAVAKAPLAGATDGVPAIMTYNATWSCTALDGDVFGGRLTGLQEGGSPAQIEDDIPQGSTCYVVEDALTPLAAPFHWNAPEYSVSGLGENGGAEVSIPNPLDPTAPPAVEFEFNGEAGILVSIRNSVSVDPGVIKEFVGATQVLNDGNWEGDWDVAYRITVTNPSTSGSTTYQLIDQPMMEEGITINSGVATSDVLADPVAWDAGSEFELAAAGTALDADQSHSYLVTFNITAPGLGAALECDGQGSGLVNQAHLISGSYEDTDEACGTLPPTPAVSIAKKLSDSPYQREDGSWLVAYEIEVTNDSDDLATHFTLDDSLRFGDGIVITSATVEGPGVSADSAWDGIENTSVVADQPLAPGANATYAVAVTADVTRNPDAGNTWHEALDCELTENETGTGFLNEATVWAGGKESTDTACGTPVIPEISKTFTSATQNMAGSNWDGSWNITYNLQVTNPSESSAVRYGLIDEPQFDPEVTIHSGHGEPASGGDAVEWQEGEPFILVPHGEGELEPGASAVYTVSFNVSAPVGEAVVCGADSVGLRNLADLSSGELEFSDEDCGNIPQVAPVELIKDLLGVGRADDGSWNVEYLLSVHNPNEARAARYTLDDSLRFGESIGVLSATVEGPGVPADSAWDGIEEQRIVTDRTLAAGGTEEYVVSVNARVLRLVDMETMSNIDCFLSEDETGTGFLNVALAESEGQRMWDEACGSPIAPFQPAVLIEKEFVPGSAQPVIDDGEAWDGIWQLDYVITVTNPASTSVAEYTLRDDVSVAGADVLGINVSGGALAEPMSAEGGSIVIIPDDDLALIGKEDTHTYQVRVLVRAHEIGEPLACEDGEGGVVNTATMIVDFREASAQDCGSIPALPQITLIKEAYDAFGENVSEEHAAQWELSATHESGAIDPVAGAGYASGIMLPGTVQLAEVAAEGVDDSTWMAGNWACAVDDGELATLGDDATVTLALREDSSPAQVTCVVINAEQGVDLVLEKEFLGDEPIMQGEEATYTLTIRNAGEFRATGVHIVDTLPSDLLVDSSAIEVPQGWSVSHEGGDDGGYGGTLTWLMPGEFEPGDEITVTYSGRVHELAGDLLVNSATVFSAEVELNPSDNTDTEEVSVEETPEEPTPVPTTPPPATTPATGVQPQLLGVIGALLLISGIASVLVARARREQAQMDES